ncbi:DUF2381 family protein [Pyxidicoccus xibeiensis]|uniref:DUF2381 family protein n=1 Tax=Pyxidicoccus xibeiensis TaxID=2906759 RepID=UPI0020A758D2|nr:DUF2381 family protein [Pyxidicoccus xibeiensis]MCP3136919.1 DUF2381 family protein [Pyxidicoccus xibeiensis]
MPCPTAALALLLPLLAGGAAPLEAAGWEVAGVRHVPLGAVATETATEVRVSPGRVTNLLFDSPLADVELEGRERFTRVRVLEDSLLLVPSERVTPGERLKLTVRFQDDGALPRGADFVLVAHASLAEQQVEVLRRPRTLASFQQEALAARDALRRCEGTLEGLRAELGRPEGLAGILAARLLDESGIAARKIINEAVPRARDVPRVVRATTYRSALWVAVEVEVNNTDATRPWRVAGAALLGGEGSAPVRLIPWQETPIPAGKKGRIIMQARVQDLRQGPFTLSLWEAEAGGHTVMLRNVNFP